MGELRGERLPPEIETTAFRIALEALANITLHARASEVRVAVEHHPDALLITVTDDGTGFYVGSVQMRALQDGYLGLAGMQERAELVEGADNQLRSRPGHHLPGVASAVRTGKRACGRLTHAGTPC